MKCEGWVRHGGAFTFGPVKWDQCKNEATVKIHFQYDGDIDTLPGCIECWRRCIDAEDIKVISVWPIGE